MGHNRFSFVVRIILAMFCFVGYYWSENPKPIQVYFFKIGSYPIQNFSYSGLIFFLSGISILLFSILLMYVLHIHTKIFDNYIILDGFWTARKVKIDLSNIVSAKKGKYKKNALRRSVYNLHNSGIIRFYTSGVDFIDLKDNSGFTYRIGTQKPNEFLKIIKSINKI